MDHHVHGAVTAGLRDRDVDCLTAQEDGTDRLDDDLLLDRAMGAGRVIFTQDKDFLVITSDRLRRAIPFEGVIYTPQLRMTIGHIIEDLELLAKAMTLEEMRNQIVYLPL